MSIILYEKTDGIGVITLNRPEKLNALNRELIAGLQHYVRQAGEDPEVKVIVLRGAGKKAFTAGFDLKEMDALNITDVVERRADTHGEVDFFKYMWYLPKPIICAVQGYCIGGGIQFTQVADLIIAADNATFGQPETVLGYTPEMILESYKLPLNKFTEWHFLAKYYSAEELRQMGYVNEVVPYEQLEQRTMEVARQVARIPAESMAIMKYTIRKCYDLRGVANVMDFTAEMFSLNRIRMEAGKASSAEE